MPCDTSSLHCSIESDRVQLWFNYYIPNIWFILLLGYVLFLSTSTMLVITLNGVDHPILFVGVVFNVMMVLYLVPQLCHAIIREWILGPVSCLVFLRMRGTLFTIYFMIVFVVTIFSFVLPLTRYWSRDRFYMALLVGCVPWMMGVVYLVLSAMLTYNNAINVPYTLCSCNK